MLDHLILAIDEVDKCVDELPEKSQRDGLTNSLLQFLTEPQHDWDHPLATPQLAQQMKRLKLVVQAKEIAPRFIAGVQKIFHYTELKRHTKSKKDLIKYILLEGEATAELPLSILQAPIDHSFSSFFTRLCRLMGIADLVIDARSDYQQNFIVYKPNISLYFSLNWVLVREGFGLLISFPKPLRFLKYVLRFSWALITEKEEKIENIH